jgi:ADP-ribosylglycohydrolase
MFLPPATLKAILKDIIANRRSQGHVVDGLHEELRGLPDSFDALDAFAHRLAALPLREDWPYREPEEWEEILNACDPARPIAPLASLTSEEASARIEAAFLASVCGCILGKPLELDPSLAQLREALEPRGEWPLRDYISQDLRVRGKWKPEAEATLHEDAWHTCRENIRYVAPDDDINYTILGMLTLEAHGADFSWGDIRRLWRRHVSLSLVYGPERTIFARCALDYLEHGLPHHVEQDQREWVRLWNSHDELCGAQIRADAYGYACPGHPALAAQLAWRDAAFTHRKTGVYATMFTAAAIATAFVERDPLQVFATALQFVPQQSRFHRIVSDSLHEVSQATDWLDGYHRIHGKYKEYSHCQIYQETGTLINTLRFAEDIGDGICKQVSQGNDTDSFGATAGSILGAYFGPGHLDARWLEPFQDEIRTGLNFFYERSLSTLARRMGELPARLSGRA